MIIQHIEKDIDEILPGETDIDAISPLNLLDLIETENRLYQFERQKKKYGRKKLPFFKRLLRM